MERSSRERGENLTYACLQRLQQRHDEEKNCNQGDMCIRTCEATGMVNIAGQKSPEWRRSIQFWEFFWKFWANEWKSISTQQTRTSLFRRNSETLCFNATIDHSLYPKQCYCHAFDRLLAEVWHTPPFSYLSSHCRIEHQAWHPCVNLLFAMRIYSWWERKKEWMIIFLLPMHHSPQTTQPSITCRRICIKHSHFVLRRSFAQISNHAFLENKTSNLGTCSCVTSVKGNTCIHIFRSTTLRGQSSEKGFHRAIHELLH